MQFDASMLVIMAIFVTVWAVLKVFFFQPLVAVMNRREERVTSAREIYARAEAEAEKRLAEERARLLDARRAASGRRDELRRDAQEQRRRMVDGAKETAQLELAEASSTLRATVDAESAKLEAHARGLAGQMSERLLGRAV